VPSQRIDPTLRNIAESIKMSYPAGELITFLDLKGNGFAPTVIRYYLNGHMRAYYRTLQSNPNQRVSELMLKNWSDASDHIYVYSAPNYLFEMLGFSQLLFETARILKLKYAKNSKILLLDLQSNGDEARKLMMLIHEHFLVTVKDVSDFDGDAATLIKAWVSEHDHVYVLSADNSQAVLIQRELR